MRQQRRKPTPRATRARIVAAELLDKFCIDADDSLATFDLRLARGNPRRRLLVGSKGRLAVVVAVHDGPPRSGNRRLNGNRLPMVKRRNFGRSRPPRQAGSRTTVRNIAATGWYGRATGGITRTFSFITRLAVLAISRHSTIAVVVVDHPPCQRSSHDQHEGGTTTADGNGIDQARNAIVVLGNR